jgi:hypothetical protein
MGLLQDLPTGTSFEQILTAVVGDEAAGTGVAGALGLLRQLDPSAGSASLSAELDGSFKANVPVDAGGLTAAPLEQLEQVARAVPADQASLVAPLASRLATLREAVGPELPAQLLNGIEGLRDLESLAPADASALAAGAAKGIDGLKAKLAFGAFAELRDWSASIRQISAEIEPLLAGGPGTIESRLIEYLTTRLGELAELLLPSRLGLATGVVDPLRAALSPERLTAFGAARRELVERIELARADLAAGNDTNTTHLAASQAVLTRLTSDLAELFADVRAVLDAESASPEGLLRAVQERLDELVDLEIVDLGNLRARLAAAIDELQQTIQAIDLQAPLRQVGSLFDRVDAAIEQSQLRRLGARIDELTDRVRESLDGVDAAILEIVASVRNLFARLKEALQHVLLAVGTFDAEGRFHFALEQQLTQFLEDVRAGLRDNLQPLLERFRASVGEVLDQVAERLEAVRGQIESVKRELRAALEGVPATLEGTVTTTIEAARQRLLTMLDQLGRVDFDVVVDPVIAQIEELREVLAGIDVSGLSEPLLGALRLGVRVIVEVDFGAQITAVLLQEMDRLLQVPRDGLAAIEARAEAALQALGALEPGVILAPLQELYGPIQELLDTIELESLTEPIDAWYQTVVAELDQFDPRTLLRPLGEVHARLQATTASVTPTALIRPLQELLDGLTAELRKLDLDALGRELDGAVGRARQLLESLSPARLLGPLATLFDKILAALDGFDPAALLEPFTGLFARIAAPLERLTPDHARAVGLAFAPLRAIPERLDPRQDLQLIRSAATEALELLGQLDIGRLLTELKGPYDALSGAFKAAGAPTGSPADLVQALNPLRDPTLGRAAAELPAIQAGLQALATIAPSAELERRYDQEVGPKLAALVPAWAGAELTPAELRRAFEQANPLAVGAEVNRLWQAFKEQLATLSPRVVAERLQASYDRLLDAVLALSPERLLAALKDTLDELVGKLDALDLGIVVDELDALAGEVAAVVAALDPAPVIAGLEALTGDVKDVLAALNPAEALRELDEPLAKAREITREFEPAAFAEPLQEVFEQIQAFLSEIDIGVLLEPLADKLTELRDDLEASLARVETAFNGMVAAVPVSP